MSSPSSSGRYRTIWRWHFYAGVLLLPLIVTLSLSGSLYLFKPQIDRWEERHYLGLALPAQAAAPQLQVQAAITAYPGAGLLDYRLPAQAGDAALIRLALREGGVREVFVSPDAQVLGVLLPEARIMAVVKRVHSQLLMGTVGNRIVELAASWAIVMILSGLYLWWPCGRGVAGVIWPRLSRGGRVFWRDLHAVVGFWISGLALMLLLTGLPWTGAWGSAFQTLRAEMGWVRSAPSWDVDGLAPAATAHAQDHHGDGVHAPIAAWSPQVFDAMVHVAHAQGLAFPAVVVPPGAPGRFGQPGENVWTLRSDATASLQQTIRFDASGTHRLSHERFHDGHVIDRVVGYGIAWHEGQLFGWISQLIGVLTALGLVTLTVSGFFMWRRRKPAGVLGAPSPLDAPRAARLPLFFLLLLASLLPLLALSLVLVWLMDRLLLPRLPALARWLGMPV